MSTEQQRICTAPMCLAHLSLIVGLSLLTGYADLHVYDRMLPLALVGGLSFLLGLSEPRRSVLWAVIMGLGLPAVHLASHLVDYSSTEGLGEVWAAFVAFGPAFLGAGLGAALNLTLSRLTRHGEPVDSVSDLR